MAIDLTINFERDNAKEAKRALTNLVEKINQEHQKNDNIRFKNHHYSALGNLVINFNLGKLQIDPFKNSLLYIFNEITGIKAAQNVVAN